MKTAVAENDNLSFSKESTGIRHVLQIVQWLSIDVAAGAVCCSALACDLMNVWPLPWLALCILGATVWLIYTADHLADVKRMPTKPVTGRHLFHWQHKDKLQKTVATLSIITGLLAFMFLPSRLIWFGIILGGLVILYIALVNTLSENTARKWFHKEIYVAVLYAAGVWGVAFMQAKHITVIHWLSASAFFLVVLQNLFLFSYYELHEDIQQRQRSIAKTFGKAFTAKVLLALFIVFIFHVLLLWLVSADTEVRLLLITLCSMSAVLGILYAFPLHFILNHLYRALGDAVFFLPGLILLIKILFT